MARTRGAGVAEFALGVSFVLTTSVGAISTFTEESADALDDRGSSIGAPDLDDSGTTTTTTSPSGTGTEGTTTTTEAPAPPNTAIASASGSASSSGNKWTATVVVSVTDNGAAVHKAAVTGLWVQQPGNSSTTPTPCETLPNGTCTFALRNLPTNGNSGHVASVTFTVTSVTPDGGTTNYPNVSVTVTEP